MARLWLVAALALLLAGCTSTITGKAVVNQAELQQYQEEHAPLTSRLALGDVSTVDYCSLLAVDAAKQAGATTTQNPTSSFNYCAVNAKIGADTVEIGVGYLEDGPDNLSGKIVDPTKQLPRGLSELQATNASADGCRHYLRFADGATIEDYVQSYTGSASPALRPAACQVEGAMFDGLVANVTGHAVRHLTFAPGSLGTVRACDVLRDDQVAGQLGPGVGTHRAPTIATGHRCRWSSAVGTVTLAFDLGFAPAHPTTPVSGRPTQVNDLHGTCLMETSVGQHAGGPSGENELADLLVNTRDQPESACPKAQALAAIVWPALPAH